jgi:hypothetical protein
MKKIYFAILSLFIISKGFAQEQNSESGLASFINKYRIGLYGGIGTSNLNPTSSRTNGDYNYTVTRIGGKASFAGGLSAEKVIDKRYSITTGLGLEWIGGTILNDSPLFSKADSNEYARKAEVTYRLQYLNLPIGLKLKASSIKKFTIYGLVGLDVGVPIGRKADYVISKYDSSTIGNQGEKLRFATITPISLAYHAGLGSEFKITSDNSAYITLLYMNGFLDHTNPTKWNKPNAQFRDGIIRSNNISFRLGFFF